VNIAARLERSPSPAASVSRFGCDPRFHGGQRTAGFGTTLSSESRGAKVENPPKAGFPKQACSPYQDSATVAPDTRKNAPATCQNLCAEVLAAATSSSRVVVLEDVNWKPAAPMIILTGADDDWTPAPPCHDLAARFPDEIAFVAYPGAYHDFDAPNLPVKVRTGATSTPTGTAHVGTTYETHCNGLGCLRKA
jgi:alpha-beta hydrolase superfamily lysophospholipase